MDHYKVLVTSSSFMDTPGGHLAKLRDNGLDAVYVPGPLSQRRLLDVLEQHQGGFDAYLCGEDEFNAAVMQAISPRAKVISKFGVGLDKVDLAEAEKLGIKVLNTPGTSHNTVAELTIALFLSLARRLPEQNSFMHRGEWTRMTGSEMCGKVLGVVGFGRVGREVAKRAMALGMDVLVYNTSWNSVHSEYISSLNAAFSHPVFSDSKQVHAKRVENEYELFGSADFVSLHISLNRNNQRFLGRRRLLSCKRGARIVNVSRGGLVDQEAMADLIRSGHIAGYGADVVDPEPIRPDNPLLGLPNVHLTPHVGSRTFESVVRQGSAAVENIVEALGLTKRS